MSDEMLKQAMEIIADGCGCHRECEQLAGSPDAYCGCEKDAEKIIALVRAAASAEPVDWQFKRSDGKWVSLNMASKPEGAKPDVQYRPLYTHPTPDAEIVAALETGRRYIVGYYNAALMSYDSAKAFEHNAELQKIDAALTKAKGGSPDAVIKKTPGPELKVKR